MDFTFEEFEELFDLEADLEAARIADALLAAEEEEEEAELQAHLHSFGNLPGRIDIFETEDDFPY